ncbi:MAG: hypothetical protein V4671_26440, partial [Armatimonadota bacterium]
MPFVVLSVVQSIAPPPMVPPRRLLARFASASLIAATATLIGLGSGNGAGAAAAGFPLVPAPPAVSSPTSTAAADGRTAATVLLEDARTWIRALLGEENTSGHSETLAVFGQLLARAGDRNGANQAFQRARISAAKTPDEYAYGRSQEFYHIALAQVTGGDLGGVQESIDLAREAVGKITDEIRSLKFDSLADI